MAARDLAARALASAARRAGGPPPAPEAPLHVRHPRASDVFARLRRFPDLGEQESREAELLDHFGWETAQKTAACRRWMHPGPEMDAFLQTTGLSFWEYAVLHQYGLINRMDPMRPDLFWAFDALLARLERLGGPSEVRVLDFGAGLGQNGLAFALAGYDVVLSERQPEQVAFARHLIDSRALQDRVTIHEAGNDEYLRTADEPGKPFGLVIEWAVLEHVPDLIAACAQITGGLPPGGAFLTTTLDRDWTPELKAFYVEDAGSEEAASHLWSPATQAWVAERFTRESHPPCLARVLVRR